MRRSLGGLERQVLTVILALHGEGYAVTIWEEIKARFGRTLSLGAIYATVDRLEQKRMVSSRLGSPTPERGGKPKRFYTVESAGQIALADARVSDNHFWTNASLSGALS